jgi:hypothetical protein
MRINTKNGLPSQAVLSVFFIEPDYPRLRLWSFLRDNGGNGP